MYFILTTTITFVIMSVMILMTKSFLGMTNKDHQQFHPFFHHNEQLPTIYNYRLMMMMTLKPTIVACLGPLVLPLNSAYNHLHLHLTLHLVLIQHLTSSIQLQLSYIRLSLMPIPVMFPRKTSFFNILLTSLHFHPLIFSHFAKLHLTQIVVLIVGPLLQRVYSIFTLTTRPIFIKSMVHHLFLPVGVASLFNSTIRFMVSTQSTTVHIIRETLFHLVHYVPSQVSNNL
jgi:hypothetical protein